VIKRTFPETRSDKQKAKATFASGKKRPGEKGEGGRPSANRGELPPGFAGKKGTKVDQGKERTVYKAEIA